MPRAQETPLTAADETPNKVNIAGSCVKLQLDTLLSGKRSMAIQYYTEPLVLHIFIRKVYFYRMQCTAALRGLFRRNHEMSTSTNRYLPSFILGIEILV